jgi:two-component system cell cycle response regulator CtrA
MGSEMAELIALRREVEALRDALEAMCGALAADAGLKIIEVAKLTFSERLLLGLLMRRQRATKEQMMTVLYADRPDDEPGSKILEVMICKMRKKLSPHGVEICTIRGAGYKLTPTSREKIKALMTEAA